MRRAEQKISRVIDVVSTVMEIIYIPTTYGH